MIYFIHRFNPIDLKTFVESKGLTYQDPNDIQIEDIESDPNDIDIEDVESDETTGMRKRYRYEQM